CWVIGDISFVLNDLMGCRDFKKWNTSVFNKMLGSFVMFFIFTRTKPAGMSGRLDHYAIFLEERADSIRIVADNLRVSNNLTA
ncbi:MAG TPA: hypothetical protein VL523_11195, partial [Terriglobia bacterium]|nr:hypothetical protein [Terriglobia bacterium]